MKNEKVVIRQEEDDDGDTPAGLPPLVPGILKIVGSALAGNITSVIDSSVALFPAEANIGGKISDVITILVDSVKNATGVGVASNRVPAGSNKASTSTIKNVKTTTAATLKTTSSDEEDSDEKEILRTNTSARPVSTTAGSTPRIEVTKVPTPDPTTVASSPSTETIDNKANWVSLLFNSSDSIQNLNIAVEDSQEAAPSSSAPSKPVRDNDKGPAEPSLNDTTAKLNLSNSFGSKLSLTLNGKQPDLSNFTDILQKFDHLANLTGLNRITEPEIPTTSVPVTVTATAATLTAVNSSSANVQVGPITIFSEFDRTTTEITTSTTEDDEDEDEDEDENRAIS